MYPTPPFYQILSRAGGLLYFWGPRLCWVVDTVNWRNSGSDLECSIGGGMHNKPPMQQYSLFQRPVCSWFSEHQATSEKLHLSMSSEESFMTTLLLWSPFASSRPTQLIEERTAWMRNLVAVAGCTTNHPCSTTRPFRDLFALGSYTVKPDRTESKARDGHSLIKMNWATWFYSVIVTYWGLGRSVKTWLIVFIL